MWNEKIRREGLDQPKSMIKYRTGNPGSGVSGKIFSKHLFSSLIIYWADFGSLIILLAFCSQGFKQSKLPGVTKGIIIKVEF